MSSLSNFRSQRSNEDVAPQRMTPRENWLAGGSPPKQLVKDDLMDSLEPHDRFLPRLHCIAPLLSRPLSGTERYGRPLQ